MIQKLEISGVHMDVGDDLKKYVTKKIGHLDRYVSRRTRVSLHAEIKLKEGRAKDKNQRTCEVILFAPHEVLTANETTINIYAAVDIAEAKLKTQLRKYKEQHAGARLYRRLVARNRRDNRSLA